MNTLFFLLFIVFFYYIQQKQFLEITSKYSTASNLRKQKKQSLIKKEKKYSILKDLIDKIETLEANIDRKSSFIQHVFGPEDNLWDLAKYYWGQGNLYPYLLENNPNLNINKTLSGTIVLIGPYPLNVFPKEYILNKGQRRYYNYQVLHEESVDSLSKRLYGDNDTLIRLFKNDNQNKIFKRNERIWIPLPY